MTELVPIDQINTQPIRKMTQAELDTFLEDVANTLRGNVDHSEFRGYVFALLFYKRISDAYQEEVAALEEELGDAELARDPRMHNFVVPEDALWETVVRKTSRKLGHELNEAMIAIERANQPKFDGLLTSGIDFDNRDKLPRDKLVTLINKFSAKTLDRAHVSDDLFGDAYEYLIRNFASKAGKRSGEFYTPPEVAYLMAQVVEPKEGEHICDWACGSGGLLLQCVRYERENGGDPNKLFLYGQESNLTTFNIARLNLILHGIRSANLRHGDSLRNPQHLDDDGRLKKFNLVVMNPPFSLSDWGVEMLDNGDPYDRMDFGIPPTNNGDYAWMQHIMASLRSRLDEDGRAMVVMSQGILFRGQPEQTEEEDGQNRKADDEYLIRRGFIENDWIEMIVVLPAKLFYGNNVPGCLVLLNKRKPAKRKDKILMVYASRHYENANPQNLLRSADLMRILVPWHAYGDLDEAPALIDTHEMQLVEKIEARRAEQLQEIAEAYNPVLEPLPKLRAELGLLKEQNYNAWKKVLDAEHPFFGFVYEKVMAGLSRDLDGSPPPEKEIKVKLKEVEKGLRSEIAAAKREQKARVKKLKQLVKALGKLEEKRDTLMVDVNAKADRELSDVHEAAADLRRICVDPEEAQRYFSVVEREEIEENEFNLNMPRYVDTFEPEEKIAISDALHALRASQETHQKAAAHLEELLGELNIDGATYVDASH